MKLTKRQTQKIRTAHKKALNAENLYSLAMQDLCDTISGITGVEGNVDYLQGDGFGFTPEVNNDTHIPIDLLIDFAEKEKDINIDLILNNLSL